jgi:hypothetical protein
MGRLNPFFERAGFQRVPMAARNHRSAKRSRAQHSAIYGTPGRKGRRLVSQETHRKSRYAAPAYFVFDNRQSAAGR